MASLFLSGTLAGTATSSSAFNTGDITNAEPEIINNEKSLNFIQSHYATNNLKQVLCYVIPSLYSFLLDVIFQ